MGKFKGTKGKWVIGVGDPNGVKLEAIRIQSDDIDRWDICAVWNDVDSNIKISESNALLISKAPEMLEMLEKMTNANPMHEGYHKLRLEAINLIKQATEL